MWRRRHAAVATRRLPLAHGSTMSRGPDYASDKTFIHAAPLLILTITAKFAIQIISKANFGIWPLRLIQKLHRQYASNLNRKTLSRKSTLDFEPVLLQLWYWINTPLLNKPYQNRVIFSQDYIIYPVGPNVYSKHFEKLRFHVSWNPIDGEADLAWIWQFHQCCLSSKIHTLTVSILKEYSESHKSTLISYIFMPYWKEL